jgi:uncharacterized membrane protein
MTDLETLAPEPKAVYPSSDDQFVGGLSVPFGGPVGRFARSNTTWWIPVRVALVIALLVTGLAWNLKAPCNSNENWANDKQYTTFCYSDVIAVTSSSGVINGKLPYRDTPTEYPVIIGGLMWSASQLAILTHSSNPLAVFFNITAVILGAALLLVVALMGSLVGPTRRWDVVMVAAAPVWVVHAFTNWDLAATAFLTLGMFMWARRSPLLAGLFIGLGTATKLYPLLIVFVLLALAWRTGKWADALKTAVFSVVTAVFITLPVYLWAPHGVARFFVLNSTRPADWDSLWLMAENHLGLTISTSQLNMFSALLFAAVAALVVMLTFLPQRRPRLPALLLVLVVGFLLVNKVHSPQYSIWLIPLVVLAYPRWITFLLWQISEVLVTITRYLYFLHINDATRGVPQGGFEAALLFRDFMLVVIVGLVIWGMFDIRRDPVRATGVDDPAGGVFDGAPDLESFTDEALADDELVSA